MGNFCRNCGQPITGRFCSSCGAPVNGEPADPGIMNVNGVNVDLTRIRQVAERSSRLEAGNHVKKLTGADVRACMECVDRAMQYRSVAEIERKERLEQEGIPTCPRCHSTQLSANKKGFSLGKAAVGAVFIGPVGLVGGMFGRNKIKLTCLNCGHKFDIQKK